MLYDMEVDTFSSVSPFWCARMAPTDEAIVQYRRGKRARDAQGYDKQTKNTHSTDPFSILTQFPAAPLELERDGKVICDCVVALNLPKVSS